MPAAPSSCSRNAPFMALRVTASTLFNGTNRNSLPAFTSLGAWHVLEMMIQPNTPNVADGHQAFWIDGAKIYTASGINWPLIVRRALS